MSNWRDALQPASFRGVPFECLNDSVPVGRRVQVHEFVQRDKPYPEDLGAATRPFAVTAFVGGADCLDRRDALIEAVSTPGPGELILPAWGAVQAACTRCEISHSREEGGIVRFDLEFVESGEGDQPFAEVATGAMLLGSLDGVMSAAEGWLTSVMDAVLGSRVNLSTLGSSLAAPFGMLSRLFGAVSSFQGFLTPEGFASALLSTPESVLRSIWSGVAEVRALLRDEDAGTALAHLRRAASESTALPAVSSAGGVETIAVGRVVQEVARCAQLVTALEAAAQLPVFRPSVGSGSVPDVWQQAQQPVLRPEVLYLPEVLSARNTLDEALWVAQHGGSGRPPMAVFSALQNARTAARRHMAQAAAASVPMVIVRPPAVLPALVLAYRQWGDASRGEEICARNRVVHPGFVPQVPLQMARE